MKERRKRVSRPKRLTLFGIFFLMLPIINYIGIAIRNKYAFYEFRNIISEFRIFELVLLTIPIIVGIGILLVQKWGYWLFITYSSILVIYNTIILVLEPKPYNINSFFQTLIVFTAIYYFLKKDVSAPFLFRPLEIGINPNYQKKLNEIFSITDGFRRSKRKPIKIEILVGNSKLKTIDFSEGGFYGQTSKFDYQINEEVQVQFTLNQKEFKLKGGVARIDEIKDNHQKESHLNYKVGIAFRGLSESQTNELKQLKKEQV